MDLETTMLEAQDALWEIFKALTHSQQLTFTHVQLQQLPRFPHICSVHPDNHIIHTEFKHTGLKKNNAVHYLVVLHSRNTS